MRLFLALIPTVLVVLVGCSGERFPETYAVTGVVTYQDQPVEGATVTLIPSDPKGRSASGITDAEGKFSVKTYITSEHQPEGALPGDYAITVSKMQRPEIPEGLSPQEEMAAFTKLGPPKSLLPKAYQSPNTSGMKLTVDDASPDPLNLDLEG